MTTHLGHPCGEHPANPRSHRQKPCHHFTSIPYSQSPHRRFPSRPTRTPRSPHSPLQTLTHSPPLLRPDSSMISTTISVTPPRRPLRQTMISATLATLVTRRPKILDPKEGLESKSGSGEEVRIAGPSEVPWEPLRLDPTPSQELLHDQLDTILAPVWANEDLSTVTTQDDIRQVEGISQILVTAERHVQYASCPACAATDHQIAVIYTTRYSMPHPPRSHRTGHARAYAAST